MMQEGETAREHLRVAEALLVPLIEALAQKDMTTELVMSLVAVRDHLQVVTERIEAVRSITDVSMSVERAVKTAWSVRELL